MDYSFYDELKDCVSSVELTYMQEVKKSKRDFVVQKTTDFRLNKYEKVDT